MAEIEGFLGNIAVNSDLINVTRGIYNMIQRTG
jgi:hypothetical protein